jgi:hypothetical protein
MPIRDWMYIAEMRYQNPVLQKYLQEHGTPPFPTYLNEAEEVGRNIYIEEDRDINEHELDDE